jgi:hypothetical protein
VELDYLPDSEVFVFQPCLYPMKSLHPRRMYTHPCRGVQGGVTTMWGMGGAIPLVGGLRHRQAPDRGSRVKTLKEKLFCKCIL